MKWQNLIRKECPACGARIQAIKDRVVMYECVRECGFSMTRTSLVRTLSDPNHILRKYLTKEEKKLLTEALKETV